VVREAVISSILVSLMILFFLGSFRSVAVVSSSIPLAILAGVASLFITGNTFNIMTLGGLALAIGMLVDDATVAVESIHRNRSQGKGLTVAILDGAHEVATPALAATLTICIVFFPVVLLEGPARYLFTPLAIAVVFAMLASYVLSRTLVPALSRLLEANEHAEEGQGLFARFNRWRDDRFDRFRSGYAGLLQAALHHRLWVLGVSAALVLISFTLPPIIGLDFFPSVDAGLMRLHFRAPMGTRITDTERLVLEAERKIRDIIPREELQALNDNIGLPLFYNLAFVSTDNIGPQDAEILISLKPEHRPTAEYMRRIREEVARDFPGSTIYFQPADIVTQVLNFGLPAPIDVQIEFPDLTKGYDVGRQMAAAMRRIPGVVDVRIPQVLDYPALQLDVDRSRAAQVGLSERDVANNLLTSLSSSSLVNPSFWLSPQNNVNYNVAVQTPLPRMRSTNDLLATPMTTGTQGLRQTPTRGLTDAATSPGSLYLGTFAQLSPSRSLASVNHSTIQRVINVQAAAEGRDLGSVANDIQRAIKQLKNFPPTMKISVRGQIESMRTSFGSLAVGLILAVVLVYLLMVVLFQSFLDPLIILGAVPGAMVGVLWMLALTGTTLNVESFMGAIMAVGIAVSNSILLVSYANEIRAERKMGALEAALEAGRVRLRPVLMTALAMILGMLPMALALGEGGEQNAPLGRAVIGGLLVATFVTLLVVPVVYSVLRPKEPAAHRLDERFLEESRGANPGALA
jgi:multidrug efflux pump subunit AcrB